jgi:hypothetical protein
MPASREIVLSRRTSCYRPGDGGEVAFAADRSRETERDVRKRISHSMSAASTV